MLGGMSPRLVRALVAVAFVACVAAAFFLGQARRPDASVGAYQTRATPGVVVAIHDLSRLEAASFHIEKVIEVTDEQSRLWGLVQAKDALMLVAVGDVTTGVDLSKVREGDVTSDPARRSARVRLPAPEILSSALDERATHVYSRSTDLLAARNERLEGAARLEAEEQMRKAALDAGALERARQSAERTIRALLASMGFEHVELDWSE
jgi:hypothetical protein